MYITGIQQHANVQLHVVALLEPLYSLANHVDAAYTYSSAEDLEKSNSIAVCQAVAGKAWMHCPQC
jgi:hypothetical protein